FPISFSHLEDILINSKQEQKEKLIDTMVSISKGWVLQPYTMHLYKEISNAILHRLGHDSKFNIRSDILAKGLPFIVSTGYQITWNKSAKNIPDDFEQKLKNVIESPQSLAMVLKDPDFSTRFKQFRKENEGLVQKMESNRLQKQKLDKKQRYDQSIGSYLLDAIEPRLPIIPKNTDPSITKKVIPQTKEDMEEFLVDMPSTNIVFRLTYARDEFYDRPIQINDVADINHLATAIPNCDIVVMERMFASESQKLGLDKKYGCKIFRSLKELNQTL
ncbi:MAG: hypothetical protein KGL95_06590, partial [Patescibacteria group bacterium]|nr:hypothetical protein [Patescibacteria group bacterium]